MCHCIILFADDMLLLAPSISALQTLVTTCEHELQKLELKINTKKSYCLRIGPRHKIESSNIISLFGGDILWAKTIRYLGIYIASSYKFSCTFDNAKRSFYRSFNAIFGKIGSVATEDVILFLIRTKCLPTLLYGLEAVPLKKSVTDSLQFTFNRTMFKLFRTRSIDIVLESLKYFNIPDIKFITKNKKIKFYCSVLAQENTNVFFLPFHEIIENELKELTLLG